MIYVGELADIPDGESVRVQGSVAIAVFNVDGDLYAIDDTCTHQDASLSDGWLEGCAVECPLHAACFDLRTGAPAARRRRSRCAPTRCTSSRASSTSRRR